MRAVDRGGHTRRLHATTAGAFIAGMSHFSAPRVALVLALAITTSRLGTARADCDRLTRPIAARIATTARRTAPAWVRPLLAPAQLMRFDATNYHALTFFLGYSAVTLERLGTGGAAPFVATVVVRCRDGRAELVSDPYAWANARATELHLTVTSSEQAAGYAAEVISLSTGHRPDSASARRTGGVYRVEVSLAARQGEASSAPQNLVLEVGRDASIHPAQP